MISISISIDGTIAVIYIYPCCMIPTSMGLLLRSRVNNRQGRRTGSKSGGGGGGGGGLRPLIVYYDDNYTVGISPQPT